ncbi:CHAD domain-containing protein [Chitinophaga sp. YR627]|uniref:CHAD domain-containing protein n=1 Tax=Chitinophaga sp. YR627 TaxID=1881041 RepID=UPI0008E54A06|nr:CHAD domain-containing protein [Chitinophaga sp. YR627]SFO02442.1 CHAD domain-containing protein [Chitinophaga sp. YR627]
MLKRTRQRKYLIKRCLKVRRRLRTFASSGEQQELHKLRVELKKLKAFIKLVTLYRGNKQLAVQLRSIRLVFHHAGVIREADLNLQMMQQFHINRPAVKDKAGRILQQEPGKFRSHVTHYDHLIKDLVRSLLRLIRPLRDRKLKRWIDKQVEKIAVIVTGTPTDQLHTARKRIKHLGYIYEICPKHLRNKLALNADYLDQLQDVIGEWHDMDVAIRLLDAHNGRNQAGLDKLRKQREQEEKEILKKGKHFEEKVLN